jgi:very-short-patch-repair endonuclease
VGLPPRTTIGRSVVDAAAWARTGDEARMVLVAACQQRLVTPGEVTDALALLPEVRRRALIRTTLADIGGGAEALSEIDFVALCRRHRLPRPDPQVRRTDADGRERYLDAYWKDWHLHAEVDGAHHMDARHWAADMQRQNKIWISGDRILRFPAALIREGPAEVAAQLRAALTAAGWRPNNEKPAREQWGTEARSRPQFPTAPSDAHASGEPWGGRAWS